MPKIFVLRNRLQEQQARLLETQKGQQIKIRSDELQEPEQDQPVALIVNRKSDIAAAVVSDKDNCPQSTGIFFLFLLSIYPAFNRLAELSGGATRMILSL